ncbi:hypothetical protein SDC9_101325 [bioreactor metagenome]|uniref:Uncharacterized protein n=1 Tax=bioreactor metagenome TaxID=1076179 RepID=A0A645ANC6_9ZZZZ
MIGDAAFGNAGLARLGLHRQHQLGLQDFQGTATEHGQRAVRWNAANGLVVFEIVTELGDFRVVLVLGFHLLAAQQALGPQPLAHVLHQRGVFGPTLGKDIAHAVQHRRHGGEISAGLAVGQHFRIFQKGLGLLVRVQRRVGKQLVGQRLDAEFLGDLALGAALLLERQIDVFQFLLGRRGGNRGAQRIGQLALLVNGLEHRLAAVVQLAQIGQALVQRAQLRIVQTARGLLAVAGHKRNRGAAIEQLHCRAHLLRLDIQFLSNLTNDFLHSIFAPRRSIQEANEFAIGMPPHGTRYPA